MLKNIAIAISLIIVFGVGGVNFAYAEVANKAGNKVAFGLSLDQAIDKAIKNISRSRLQPAHMIMFIRMGEIYNIKSFVDLRKRYQRESKSLTGKDLERLKVYERIIDHKVVVAQSILRDLKGFDAITMEALYCDIYPFDKDVVQKWLSALAKGGYDATHVPMAYRFSLDNECTIPGFTKDLEKRIVDANLLLVKVEDGFSDLELEALTFLALINMEHVIEPHWVDLVVAAQRSDGGWADGSEGAVNPHATGLALWLLLDWRAANSVSPIFLDR